MHTVHTVVAEPDARGVLIPASASILRRTNDQPVLQGELRIPRAAPGIVVFAHNTGGSRFDPSAQYVARRLREAGLATLLFDLLTPDEGAVDARNSRLRFDIDFLAERLASVVAWVSSVREARDLRLGFFGTSTGAAAAVVAAARLGRRVGAVVSTGGRPDLAGPSLARVASPTLLVVGGRDAPVIRFNERALALLRCEKQLVVVPGATHMFEEPGTLEQAAALAAGWLQRHVRRELPASSAA